MPNLQEELTALYAKHGAAAPPAAAPAAAPAAQQPAAPVGMPSFVVPPNGQPTSPSPVGWSIPIELDVMGQYGSVKVTFDLAFAPDTWPQAGQIATALMQQGVRVKSWDPNKKRNYGGGGGGGYNNNAGSGGGYNNGGGGGWGGR